jgi:hypothetical protein
LAGAMGALAALIGVAPFIDAARVFHMVNL